MDKKILLKMPSDRNRVAKVTRDKPKPLQAKTSVKNAGEKIRLLHADQLAVASGDRLVGTVKGKYPERKAASFGHDPETTLVREIMAKEAYYCFQDQALDEAREIMREHDLQYLPVVDDHMHVVGMIGMRELAAIQQQQRRKKV
jgi:CBS domain-containing protein